MASRKQASSRLQVSRVRLAALFMAHQPLTCSVGCARGCPAGACSGAGAAAEEGGPGPHAPGQPLARVQGPGGARAPEQPLNLEYPEATLRSSTRSRRYPQHAPEHPWWLIVIVSTYARGGLRARLRCTSRCCTETPADGAFSGLCSDWKACLRCSAHPQHACYFTVLVANVCGDRLCMPCSGGG